jgi:hypothetical protein
VRWRRVVGWEPGRSGWRIAVCFMAGSLLFALGSFPPFGQTVDPRAVGATFVAGSVFFTGAAIGQLRQTPGDEGSRLLRRAGAVQVLGTLFFNVNTVDAMLESLDAERTNRLVWAPDLVGSGCFLVASWLAWVAVCGGRWCVRRDDSGWWVAALNGVGSVFFMLAAIASFTLPTTGDEVNTTLVNSGTFLGAICFLVGAYLLLPAPADDSDRPPSEGDDRPGPVENAGRHGSGEGAGAPPRPGRAARARLRRGQPGGGSRSDHPGAHAHQGGRVGPPARLVTHGGMTAATLRADD